MRANLEVRALSLPRRLASMIPALVALAEGYW
jgi:hypothetical protein